MVTTLVAVHVRAQSVVTGYQRGTPAQLEFPTVFVERRTPFSDNLKQQLGTCSKMTSLDSLLGRSH